MLFMSGAPHIKRTRRSLTNEQMKRYIILGALLVSAITQAHANLGDTRIESAQRYGQPFSHKGNGETYGVGDWTVGEWFNPSGYAESIWYYKRNGTITQEETDQF